VAFSGSGVTALHNVQYVSGSSVHYAPVSVYSNATIGAGAAVDAGNQLYIRSDVGTAADMVNSGWLTNSVKGIIAEATVTNGIVPYTSVLSLNVSGVEMQYQWQLSANGSEWTNIAGATNAGYTAQVTETKYYRCSMTTGNTSFKQATAPVALRMTVPVATGITTADEMCGIAVWPNPCNNRIAVSGVLGTATDGPVAMVITDVAGRIMYECTMLKTNGQVSEPAINTTGWLPGAYLLQLTDGSGARATRMIVKQ
jgi:hypothetical protein